jgi:hypothetical protein
MPDAAVMLRLRRALDLTDAQVRQLDTIRVQTQRAIEPHLRAARAARLAADSALAGDSPNVDRYQAGLRTAADNLVQAQVLRARAALQARGVLTPEQRSNLRFAARFRRSMPAAGMRGRWGPWARAGRGPGGMGMGPALRGRMGPGMWGPGMQDQGMRGRVAPRGRATPAPAPADTANAR